MLSIISPQIRLILLLTNGSLKDKVENWLCLKHVKCKSNIIFE